MKIIELYVKKIREGKMTLEQVPEKWRANVQEVLNNYRA